MSLQRVPGLTGILGETLARDGEKKKGRRTAAAVTSREMSFEAIIFLTEGNYQLLG